MFLLAIEILAWIKQRIKNNKNAIILIVGPTGSSKSYDALSLCEQIRDYFGVNFKPNDNIAFDFLKFLENTKKDNNVKPGTPFLFEEVGAASSGASAQSWQSNINKLFNSFMQTARHRNQILIMTTPNYSNLMKGARELVHMLLETDIIDFKNKIAYVKPYIIQTNPRTGKQYFKYMRLTVDGIRQKLTRVGFKIPSTETISEYEDLKLKFSNKLERDMINKLKKPIKRATKDQIKVSKIEKFKKKGLKNTEIANILGVSSKTIQRRLNVSNLPQI